MASRKNLKKDINFVIDELIIDCLISKQIKKDDPDKLKKIDDVISKAEELACSYIKKIKYTGEKNPKVIRNYYKNIKEEFTTEYNNLCDTLSEIIKE